MNLSSLRQFANSLGSQHNALAKLRREAAYMILNKANEIENYISEEDKVNQAAQYYTNVWKNALELTDNSKFKTYISVAKQSLNHMATFNEVEHLVKEKYESFDELADFVRRTAWANKVSYATLKEVFAIMELNDGD